MTTTTLSNTTLWAIISAMFIIVVAGAVFISPAFTSTPDGSLVSSFVQKPFDNPDDVGNSFQTFGMALGGALVFGLLVGGFLRWVLKRKIEISIRLAMTFFIFLIMNVTISALMIKLNISTDLWAVPLIVSSTLALGQYFYPEWWLIDLIAVLSAIGISAFLGSSMGILPILILLALFSLYDFLAVLCSSWMKGIAQGSADLKLPSMFVLPYDLKTSYRTTSLGFSSEKRAFMVIGTADFIFPTVLVVAAYMKTASIIALITMTLGIVLAYTVMFAILKWGPEKYKLLPGIPFLAFGVVLGFTIPCFVLGLSWI